MCVVRAIACGIKSLYDCAPFWTRFPISTSETSNAEKTSAGSGSFRKRYLLLLLIPLTLGIALAAMIPRPAVGLIYLRDAIHAFSSAEMIAQIEYARNQPEIRAVVLVIDSPGGTVIDTEAVYPGVGQTEGAETGSDDGTGRSCQWRILPLCRHGLYFCRDLPHQLATLALYRNYLLRQECSKTSFLPGRISCLALPEMRSCAAWKRLSRRFIRQSVWAEGIRFGLAQRHCFAAKSGWGVRHNGSDWWTNWVR